MKCFVIAALALVLASCVMSGQKVELSPQVRSEGGDGGRGKEIVVTVVDARANKVIGVRDPDLGRLTSITAVDGLEDNALRAVAKGLTEEGFRVVAAPPGTSVAADALRHLTVEIVALGYKADLDSVPKTITCSAEVRAVAQNNGHGLERTFKVSGDRKVVLTPSEADNESALADILSEALTNAVSDYELTSFMSKEMLRTKKIEAN
ncbi:MAG: hypothetical protein HQK81_07600 [Desulfovibrionaceae bacterium]|nr:hypothetical protein [Desulfovibrionaceae bacterium]MBF0513914.1 hypothetical protein [Desulfovibrionaceae bacterium]